MAALGRTAVSGPARRRQLILFWSMEQPLVSVIIPAWNAERFLARCIGSVVAQSYPNLEVVVVDDGSTDGTAAIADRFAMSHRCVRALHYGNAGSAEARRRGVEASRGEWIMFADSDDELHGSDAVAFLMNKALTLDLDIAYGSNIRMINGKSDGDFESRFEREGEYTTEEFRSYVLSPACICGQWGCVSRREIWLNDVFPPAGLKLPSEDIYSIMLLSNHLKRKVGLYNHAVYNYYMVAGSLSLASPYHTVALWHRFYTELESRLDGSGTPATVRALNIRKIHDLCFHMRSVDSRDPWVRSLIRLNTAGYPLKTRVCQQLLCSNAARRFFIVANRTVKRLTGRQKSTI